MHPFLTSQLAHDRRSRLLAAAERHRLVRKIAPPAPVGGAVRILAIAGSLNSASVNGTLVRAVGQAALRPDVVVLYDSLGDLPHFSPDLDREPVPAAVETLRRAVGDADVVLIATPEYAGGMPGVLKNGLDWLVGSAVMSGKRAVVVNAAPSVDRGHNARKSVEQTLSMLGARVCDSFTIPVMRDEPDDAIAAKAAALFARMVAVVGAGPCGAVAS
jgi:NAD(P)H-dependent FMN reductase